MATVFLHGYLGEKYGGKFELSVGSVAEAINLLNANFRGFKVEVLKHEPGFLVNVDGMSAGDIGQLREMHLNPEIHIVPVIRGAGGKNNGVGKIVLAAILVVAALYGNFSADTTQALYRGAFSLAISGVSDLLFSSSQKNTDSNDITGESNLANYAFNGPVNTTSQGNPVPILYGRLRVGSQVISAGMSAE